MLARRVLVSTRLDDSVLEEIFSEFHEMAVIVGWKLFFFQAYSIMKVGSSVGLRSKT